MKNNIYPQGKIPIKVGRKDFNQYIAPYLSRTKRGPKSTLSMYKIFNYILWVLHTEIQWYKLSIYRNEIHWTNVYKWHLKWSKDGSYQNLFETSIMFLKDKCKLDLSIIHGDGSNTLAKKGVKASDILDTSIGKE